MDESKGVGMTSTGMRKLMRTDQALGPLASDGLHRDHWDDFLRLYDGENILHRQAERSSPTLIVGRKGSGKRSLLMGFPIGRWARRWRSAC